MACHSFTYGTHNGDYFEDDKKEPINVGYSAYQLKGILECPQQ